MFKNTGRGRVSHQICPHHLLEQLIKIFDPSNKDTPLIFFLFFLSVSFTSTQSSKGSICEEQACVYITWKSSHKHEEKTHKDTTTSGGGFQNVSSGVQMCFDVFLMNANANVKAHQQLFFLGQSPRDTLVTILLLSQFTAICTNVPGWLHELTQMCGQCIKSCVLTDIPIIFLISGFAH